jgi:hypothetical protein
VKYEWAERLAVQLKSGVSLNAKVDPNDFGKLKDDIKNENGGTVRPEQIVERARSKRSPCHKMFEWDDAIAGERYRVAQASLALRCINVQYVPPKGGAPVSTNSVVSVLSKTGKRGTRQYVDLQDALNDRQWRDQLLMDSLNQLRAWRTKWFQLNELVDAAEPIQFVDAAIDGLMKAAAK